MSQLSERRIKQGLSQAKAESLLSDFDRYHLGAVLYYKGKMVSQGHNSKKTSPIQKALNKQRGFDPDECGSYNPIHAEVSCLGKAKDANIDFNRAVVFVYREHKNGEKAMARPCKGCMKALKDFGVKTICYTTESGYCVERIE